MTDDADSLCDAIVLLAAPKMHAVASCFRIDDLLLVTKNQIL